MNFRRSLKYSGEEYGRRSSHRFMLFFYGLTVVGTWSFGASFTSGVGCKRWGVINVLSPCQGQLTDLGSFRADVLTSTAGRQRLWDIAFPPGSSLRSCLHFQWLDADGDDWSTGYLIHTRDWTQSVVLCHLISACTCSAFFNVTVKYTATHGNLTPLGDLRRSALRPLQGKSKPDGGVLFRAEAPLP